MRIPTMHRMPHLCPRRPDSPVVISAPHREIIPYKRVVPPIAPVSPRIFIGVSTVHIRILRHRPLSALRIVGRTAVGQPRMPLPVPGGIVITPVARRTRGIKTALAHAAVKRIRTVATLRQPVKAANGIRRPRRSCLLRVVPRLGRGAPANSPRQRRIKSRVRLDIVTGRVAPRMHGTKTEPALAVVKRIRTVATLRQRVKAAAGTRSENRRNIRGIAMFSRCLAF